MNRLFFTATLLLSMVGIVPSASADSGSQCQLLQVSANSSIVERLSRYQYTLLHEPDGADELCPGRVVYHVDIEIPVAVDVAHFHSKLHFPFLAEMNGQCFYSQNLSELSLVTITGGNGDGLSAAVQEVLVRCRPQE